MRHKNIKILSTVIVCAIAVCRLVALELLCNPHGPVMVCAPNSSISPLKSLKIRENKRE